MVEIYRCLIEQHSLPFVIGMSLFLLTVLLVARRIIGFTLSVIFMLLALILPLALKQQSDTPSASSSKTEQH